MNTTQARQATARTALMAVADTAAAARRAVDEGADLVDLTGAAPAEIAAFRRARPGVPVCADAEPADLTRDPAVAASSGARLICAGQEEAAQSGLPPERLLIETSPAGLMAALAAGYPVLVDLPDSPAGHTQPGSTGPSPDSTTQPSGASPLPATPPIAASPDAGTPPAPPAGAEMPAGAEVPDDPAPGAASLAVAAISGWLGAAVVRTRYPLPVRRALDLTDSVRGVRPPARTVRGLA